MAVTLPRVPTAICMLSAANAHFISAYICAHLIGEGHYRMLDVEDFCKTLYLYLGNLTGMANADPRIIMNQIHNQVAKKFPLSNVLEVKLFC